MQFYMTPFLNKIMTRIWFRNMIFSLGWSASIYLTVNQNVFIIEKAFHVCELTLRLFKNTFVFQNLEITP